MEVLVARFIEFSVGERSVPINVDHITHINPRDSGGTEIRFVGGGNILVSQNYKIVCEMLLKDHGP